MLQAIEIQCFSNHPADSGTLTCKWNTKFTLDSKEDFGPVSEITFFLLSSGKMLLTVCGSEEVWHKNGTFVVHVWSFLMLWLQTLPTTGDASPYSSVDFPCRPSECCSTLCCCCTGSQHVSLSLNLLWHCSLSCKSLALSSLWGCPWLSSLRSSSRLGRLLRKNQENF